MIRPRLLTSASAVTAMLILGHASTPDAWAQPKFIAQGDFVDGPMVLGQGGAILVNPMVRPPQPGTAQRELKATDIFEPATKRGRLVIKLKLPFNAENRYFQPKVTGLDEKPGQANIQYGGVNNVPTHFLFTYVRPGETQPAVSLQLTAQSMMLVFVRPNGARLELSQTMAGPLGQAEEDAGAVRMTVRDGGQTITGKAVDLRTLRMERAEEFRKYVRPVLAALGGLAAALPEEAEAFQLFADKLSPDEATQAKLKELLPALDADEREKRDEASRQLDALGWRAALIIRKMDRSRMAVEQRIRLNAFLADYRTLDADHLAKARSDVNLLVDCLALGDETLVAAARARLEQLTGNKVELDPKAPQAARAARLEEIRKAVQGKQ